MTEGGREGGREREGEREGWREVTMKTHLHAAEIPAT